ncbi:hypothetical protein QBC40DRAFT_296234 [Triangularia verruculosa]|uniref:Uncharacterized protein n=1 Tax=Triangularia verruculosa TaxID=2587418 RepID=A0AAN6XHH3_9PEZI|nr:hypothetical protein QBC40DRAFT_296234 [Triangularia verruculosa]
MALLGPHSLSPNKSGLQLLIQVEIEAFQLGSHACSSSREQAVAMQEPVSIIAGWLLSGISQPLPLSGNAALATLVEHERSLFVGACGGVVVWCNCSTLRCKSWFACARPARLGIVGGILHRRAVQPALTALHQPHWRWQSQSQSLQSPVRVPTTGNLAAPFRWSLPIDTAKRSCKGTKKTPISNAGIGNTPGPQAARHQMD